MSFDNFQTTVIGAGTMGAGIAQCLADHGLSATLFDLDQEVLDLATKRTAASHQILVQAGVLTQQDAERAERLIRHTTSLEEAVSHVDLLIEAVPENMQLKCELYQQWDRMCGPEVMFASNTSGLSITQIAAATGRPELVAGMHWWNPPQLVPLVEVISGEKTSPQLIERLMQLARHVGKQPIHVRRDVPGFIGNRLQFAVLREALHLVSEGVASAEDVDLAMTCGPGFRYGFLGPLRSADLGGLEVFQSICQYLYPELSRDTAPPSALTELVQQGHFGTKTGQGFYDYDPRQGFDWIGQRDKFFLALGKLQSELKPSQ